MSQPVPTTLRYTTADGVPVQHEVILLNERIPLVPRLDSQEHQSLLARLRRQPYGVPEDEAGLLVFHAKRTVHGLLRRILPEMKRAGHDISVVPANPEDVELHAPMRAHVFLASALLQSPGSLMKALHGYGAERLQWVTPQEGIPLGPDGGYRIATFMFEIVPQPLSHPAPVQLVAALSVADASSAITVRNAVLAARLVVGDA